MWNSWFGAGEGPTAFAYDMMVLEDIERERRKASEDEDEDEEAPTDEVWPLLGHHVFIHISLAWAIRQL